MNVIFTRHTTTAWNREKRIQGQSGTSLDEGGRAEALLLGEKLASLGVKQIVSSDLLRAKQTAEIIASVLDHPVIVFDPRIRECSFGSIEGMTFEEAAARYGDGLKVHWDDQWQRYDFRPYGGEDREGVWKRHREFFDDIRMRASGGILVVGHGRGLNTLLAGLGYPPDLPRGSYRVIEY